MIDAQATNGSAGAYPLEQYTYDASSGNLISKAGVSYTYSDPAHKHAVTHLAGVQKYWYDANGNQTRRSVGGDTDDLAYDAENRLVEVKRNGAVIAAFTYDGDGERVKGSVNAVTTTYIGNYFEWSGSSSTMRKYYYAGAARVALRAGAGTGASGLNWLVSDHLGSTAITADSSGNKVAELRYKAWGETRYAWGSTPTGRQYTGQINEPSFGLYFYGARWYDASLGRFISPDPIVPGTGDGGNPNAVGYLGGTTYSSLTVDYHENRFLNQLNSENRFKSQDPYWRLQPVPTISTTFDRYAYSLNNPVRYVDPSGHFVILAALALITPVGWVAMGVTAVGVVLYFAVPGVREAVTNGIYEAREAASNGLNALFAKGEYIPPGLSSAERNAYREAVHAYKRAWGLGPKDNVPKKILDDIADAIKEGLKP